MGNRASTPSTPQKQGEGPVVEVGNDSRVIVAQELSDEIIQTFQSQILQEQWENMQKGILISHNQRNKDHNETKVAREKDLKLWRAHNSELQASLDDKINDLRYKFNDLDLDTRNAMDKLDYKLKSAPKFGNEDQCLEARAGLAKCYKDSKDIRQCDNFMEIFEQCTKQTIMDV